MPAAAWNARWPSSTRCPPAGSWRPTAARRRRSGSGTSPCCTPTIRSLPWPVHLHDERRHPGSTAPTDPDHRRGDGLVQVRAIPPTVRYGHTHVRLELGCRARRRPADRGHPRRWSADRGGRRRNREDPHAGLAGGGARSTAGWTRSGSCCSPSPAAPPTTCWPGRPRSATGGTRPASSGAAPSTRWPTGWSSAHAEAWACRRDLSVLDPGDARDLMETCRARPWSRRHRGQRLPRGDTLLDIYSRAVNTGQPGPRGDHRAVPLVRTAHRGHPGRVPRPMSPASATSRCSTSTICCSSWRALLADPVLGPVLADRCDHVLVDEYQDVNQIQVDIVSLLRPGGAGLTVVGDDAQAIYGFRGSDSRHLLVARRRSPPAPGPSGWNSNFRSRQRILALANAVRPAAGGSSAAAALRPRRRQPPTADPLPRRVGRGPRGGRRGARRGRAGAAAARPGGADAGSAPQRPARGRTHRAVGAVRQVRRA